MLGNNQSHSSKCALVKNIQIVTYFYFILDTAVLPFLAKKHQDPLVIACQLVFFILFNVFLRAKNATLIHDKFRFVGLLDM